ncbi:MAG TPA: hypothetical protein VFC00_06775 [Micromonosporaceae bacterium]|nr:hypothetical protein [Micromonosporaceae bacterium]
MNVDEIIHTYDEAEQYHVIPSIAAWARAEALKAIMSSERSTRMTPRQIADEVNMYAQLIVEGSLPEPRPGTYY